MSGDSPVPEALNASGFKIAIAAARFNEQLVDSLLQRVRARLSTAGVKEKNVAVVRVPG